MAIDISWETTKVEKIQVASLAYADDSALLVNFKENIQNIINIAESFFDLNIIKINTKKTLSVFPK